MQEKKLRRRLRRKLRLSLIHILKKAGISYEEVNRFEEKIESAEEYDLDQGNRIVNPSYITETVSYTHLEVNAVNKVNCVMEKGIYGLLGVNGAGKTTLMLSLIHIYAENVSERASSGNVFSVYVGRQTGGTSESCGR